ncbi:nucleic acid-binding, OB-fold protein [Vibrio phage 1.101.O._10N.261.45.C6]|nr:nucleic acid-binding, OB-fold protein [Vibrio phage 1.101.O._10N.261.45.C6]
MKLKFHNNQEIYKVSPSTGKIQVWSGETREHVVFCTWGELGGKQQTKAYDAKPKNVGRSNATTAEEQAIVELQAMYQSQCDNKHYKLSQIDAIESSEVCRIPRKVANYKDRYMKMSDTLWSSLKFNGSRACVVDGKLYSKIGRHEEVKVRHLRKAIEALGENATFDAEVYAHGLSLQRIRSAWLKPVKTEKEIIKIAKDRSKARGESVPTPDGAVELSDAVKYLGYNPNDDQYLLKFYVFDIPDDSGIPYSSRIEGMLDIEGSARLNGVIDSFEFVQPFITLSHEDRMWKLSWACEKGYEGLVHYEPEGVYEYGKRSTNTAKSKPRYDGEALVLSVTKDKNGEGLLHCQAADRFDNHKFKCKMKVERRDGKRYERNYESMTELVGKWITVSYEELSDKGVFTKPVGEEERECDSQGRPLE